MLSTHIVEDVSVLCPRFAVIRDGKLVARTTPTVAGSALAGKVFEGHIERSELQALEAQCTVLQAMLFGGGNRVRIYSGEGDPPAGFEPVEPTLEDAYLALMRTGENVLPDADLPASQEVPA